MAITVTMTSEINKGFDSKELKGFDAKELKGFDPEKMGASIFEHESKKRKKSK